MATRQKQIPRGIRNNNPLNIRIGNTWLGEVDHPTETQFEQFVSMEFGLRAAFLILRRYIRRYHLNTVQLIVSRWAPETENKTQSYINTVANKINIDPTAQIAYEDKETMIKLVAAMCSVENGQEVSLDKIAKGYDMA